MSTHAKTGMTALTITVLGVVFGDIGTSPLYAFKEAFGGKHALPLQPEYVFAVLSMMFWTVMLVVSLKYVLIMLRFDNQGEGGVLALVSIVSHSVRERPLLLGLVTILGAFSVSLFYGDAVITPAISVLSAVEGIAVAAPSLSHFIVPIALVILLGLFMMQRHGTATVGALFGPIMIVWFLTLAVLGLISIWQYPLILQALDPRFALGFAMQSPGLAFIALGAVFLCMTGAEAMYADMGHFGLKPIRLAWFSFVLPSLMINYFGQGALVLRNPAAITNPFYLLAPDTLLVPLIILSTLATVVASQATISGAFSATQQASRLNFLPRMRVSHTSESSSGQIYIPLVNWILLVLVVVLVLTFRSSENLASAYGIAVAGDLFLTSIIMMIGLPFLVNRHKAWLWPAFIAFAVLELLFFAANATKILDGGWFPLVLASIMFTVLTTWRVGIEIMRARKGTDVRKVDDGLELDLTGIPRVPGTAIFFSSTRAGCPSAFLHNLKHNKIVHATTIFLTVEFDDAPRISEAERVELVRGKNGLVRVVSHFGFREDPRIAEVLRQMSRKGLTVDLDETSFFTSKPTIVSVSRRGMFGWRRSLFGWMMQNSPSVANYFGLPPNRVIELGAQVGI